MNISVKNNRIIKITAIVSIILHFLSFILGIFPDVITSLIFIVQFYYLIRVLQFIKEKIAVQAPFNIFLALTIVSSLAGILLPIMNQDIYGLSLGISILTVIIIINMLWISFRIEEKRLSGAYIYFILSLFFLIVLKLTIFILLPKDILYINFANILPEIAILSIISKTTKLLKNSDEPVINNEPIT